MAHDPQGSLPRRCGNWSATLGAYRLLGNERVEAGALIAGHVQQTRTVCVDEPVVLCVQDSTELSAAYELPVTKLIQHSALAVRPDGCVLGLLAAISAVIGVRLLQLRDLSEAEQADDPRHLPQIINDPLVLQVVAKLAKVDDPTTLTPRQFPHTLARQGGWPARKHNGRPGWQTLWHGWQKVRAYAAGLRLMNSG